MSDYLKLREYRETRGLSLRELARELKVDHSTLSYWESGTKNPKASNKMKLASFFGVSADELLKKGD